MRSVLRNPRKGNDRDNYNSPVYGNRRIQTGVPRLDYILQGGFFEGGVYGVVGANGSGKTIFGNQVCFNHIAQTQGRCLYLTLLAESHARMVTHLRTLSFFKQSYIPEYLTYLSGYSILEKEGHPGLLSFINASVRQRRISLLVIDALENAMTYGTVQTFKRFIHDLQASMGLFRCTTLLLSAPRTADLQNNPESPLLEGVIGLTYNFLGPRAVRELTVYKFRGTDYFLGRHEVEITQDGISVHPRTEIQFSQPGPGLEKENRISMQFGIPKLDTMAHNGILSGSVTSLLGTAGTGKTMLGLAFLNEGARQGQKGTYFGFYEPPYRILRRAIGLDSSLNEYISRGLIEIVWQPPLEHFLDSLAERLLERISGAKTSKRRLFIDGIEGFQQATAYPERLPRFLAAFINQLRLLDVTTLISAELPLFQIGN